MIRPILLPVFWMKILSSILFFIALLISAYGSKAALICGKTYPIAEPDMRVEAHTKAKTLMHSKAFIKRLENKMKEQSLRYKPSYLEYLPPSKKSFSYKFDVLYTLPFDIPRVDKTGKVIGVLYPEGFTFHVMRYIPYFQTLVVFDIKNGLERKWVKKRYKDNYGVKLLSVSGDASDLLTLAKEMKRPVFFDIDKLNKRLDIKYTVSIVSKDKSNPDFIDIRVVGINKIKKDLKKTEVKNAEKTVSDKRHQ